MGNRDQNQCLTDDLLTGYLEGGLEPVAKAVSEVHLVSCDDCRTRLSFFMRVLQPQASTEEAAVLEAISANWAQKTRLAPLPRRVPYWRLVAAASAAAAVLVTGVATVWVLRTRPQAPRSASQVVELLLEQNRPFESRLSGEPHRPLARTRGPGTPAVSYSLLAAEMTRLDATSHEMGRFYLLQKEFGRAIPYLENAEGEQGADAAVHNDLGVAYLESATGAELEAAGKEFMHALELDRSFAPAAFNLALFYERTGAAEESAAAWSRYLRVDSNSDWAAEARDRLKELTR